MAQMIRHCLWVILAAGIVFFLNLGVPELWDEDEPKNAACAREMLERNDWVVPMFNYELRTAKPVLIYWFMMTAYEMFGVSEFGARFWSAMLGIGTCLLTYGIGRRLFQPSVGLWSALMLAAALMFGVASRAATPDAPLIFFSTLALAIFVWGLPRLTNSDCREGKAPAEPCKPTNVKSLIGSAGASPSHSLDLPPNSGPSGTPCNSLRQHIPQSWSTYLWMYAAMGVAVLAKGPVGVALPTLIVMGYLWSRHWNTRPAQVAPQSRWAKVTNLVKEFSPVVIWRVGWVLRPLTALAIVAAIALPWYVWVGWRTNGEWIAGFLGKHNVARFTQPLEGHSGPIFYYVIAVLIGFFPWSIFLPLACVRLVQRLRRPEARTIGDEFCASWALLYIGFFSLASTKLPSYVLPAYPALALITGRWVVEWLSEPIRTARWLPRWGFANMAVVGLAFIVAIPLVTARFIPNNWMIGWAGLIPLAGGLAALIQNERQQFALAARTFGAASLAFATCLFGIVAVQINPHQTSAGLMAQIFAQDPQPEIATFDYFEPSVAYYAGQPVKKLKTSEQAVTFLQSSPSAFLITRDKDLATFQDALPSGVKIVVRRPRFLKSGEIVLLAANSGIVLAESEKGEETVPERQATIERTAAAESSTIRK